jgi:hypothetical protein
LTNILATVSRFSPLLYVVIDRYLSSYIHTQFTHTLVLSSLCVCVCVSFGEENKSLEGPFGWDVYKS